MADPKTRSQATAAYAELELGICQFQVKPAENDVALVQSAAAKLRRYTFNSPISGGPNEIVLCNGRRAHAALVKQLLRLGRTVDAADTARQMSDWLLGMTPRAFELELLRKELQLAQTETLELLCATGQLPTAVEACRQHISFWKGVQRDMPQADIKPYLAGRYLTLIRLLSEMHEVDKANQAAAEADELGLNSPQTHARLARNLVIALYFEKLPLAWRIGPEVPALAVEAAQKAVDSSTQDGFYWNTLGAAQSCAGDWEGTLQSVERSMQLRSGGDASDWFLMAMAHWQLGRHAEAHTWYRKAVEWMNNNQSKADEFERFRVVATGTIGTSDPDPTIDDPITD
jgi:tetratricopeptide (TPR) repeat protein